MWRLTFNLLAFTFIMTFVAAEECWMDKGRCTERMRRLLTSEKDFWFGDDYEERCFQSGQWTRTNECQSPSTFKSVVSRFFNATVDASLVQSLELADVVYDAPKGYYYGCDNHTWVDEVNGHHIDPLEITPLNSWSLKFTPRITWPAKSGMMYTVIGWDVGYFYLHGFYINAYDGSTDSSTPIYQYSGPKNPSPTGNQYLFIIIEQDGYLDPEAVGGVLWGLILRSQFMLHPTLLLAAMPGKWTVPVAANLMTVVGDSYSVESQKTNYIINTCPWLTSQEDAIHTILTNAEIPVEWSYDMMAGNPRGELYGERRPYLHDLSADLTVEYESEEMMFESCCVKKSYSRTLYRVNPLSSRKSQPFMTRNKPRVLISPLWMLDMVDRVKDKMFTLMMVDMTNALYGPSNDMNIHWLVTNILEADVSSGDEALPYFGPNPFDRDDTRVYVFLLLKQKERVPYDFSLQDYVSDNCPDFLYMRCGGMISSMIKDLEMELSGVTWFLSGQDAYARKMIYEKLVTGPNSIMDVCDGLPGFEWPCRHEQVCSTNAAVTLPSLPAFLLMAVTFLFRLL